MPPTQKLRIKMINDSICGQTKKNINIDDPRGSIAKVRVSFGDEFALMISRLRTIANSKVFTSRMAIKADFAIIDRRSNIKNPRAG